MKLFLLLIVLAAGYGWWCFFNRLIKRADELRQRHSSAKPAAVLEDMPSCAHCGTHLPRSEAVAGVDGAIYCSAGHRDAVQPAHRPKSSQSAER